MNIIWRGTPNYSKGRAFNKVQYVVVHWIVGTLQSADYTFANPKRRASAHYGIGGDKVYQWVKESDTSWHCGSWIGNLRSIGIEHEGSPSIPISEATYKTSAKLISDICKRYGLTPSASTILPHSVFKPTQCPGTLSLTKLIDMAKAEFYGTTPPVQTKGWATVQKPQANVRTQPRRNAPLTGSRTLKYGDTFEYVDIVKGDNVSGNNKWLKSKFGNYVWSGGIRY